MGKTYSQEGKLRLSLARKGKPKPELWKVRMGLGNKEKSILLKTQDAPKKTLRIKSQYSV